MRLDRQRIAGEDGLGWTPQFRDIESLWRMSERVGERAALAFFASNLHEQVQRRKDPGRRGGRRLPDARPGRLRPLPRRARPAACRTCTATRGRSPHEPRHDRAGGGRRCSCSSCTAPPRSAAGSTPSTRTSPTTGRRILQRLYPVWALIGPGLSDPGHIEIHSRTVYLDSETLLGSRAAIAAGAARAAGDPALLRRRAARDDPRQAHQALGDRARHRARPNPTTRPTGSSRSTGGCSRSRGWKPTASATSRPTRCAAGSSAARCRRPSST